MPEIVSKTRLAVTLCVRHAVNWLKARKFDEIERMADAKGQAAGAHVDQVFVAKGTDAWNAWSATRVRGWPVVQHRLNTGWRFPSLFPPTPTANVAAAGRAASSAEASDRVQGAER
jgi:hypothetical protein